MWKCIYCGKEREDMPSIAKKRKYCNTSCQLKYEYENGIRDKFENGVKAREKCMERMNEDNWLNHEESRENLKEAQQTDEYKLKERLAHLGENNGQYGKKPGNYIDGKYRKWGNADRGFNWKAIKKKIKERDNYTCQECGKIEGEQYLQVHHIVPYRIFEDNSEENLITLCPKCHAKHEYSFLKVKGLKLIPKKEVVYNFSVDEDESYVAEDLIVHNCRSTIIFIEKEKLEKEETEQLKKDMVSKELEKTKIDNSELDLAIKEKEADIAIRKENLLKKLEGNLDGGD